MPTTDPRDPPRATFRRAPLRHRAILTNAAIAAIAAIAMGGAPLSARAQSTQTATPARAAALDPLDVMREDLRAARYDAVIRRGNDLLGSSRAFTLDEQMRLWQIMAAAYYPPDVMAQRPDSARLPLDALVRLAPDVVLAADLRWAGLDSLLERARAATFAMVARPQAEYTMTTGAPAYITVVATRPARFRLTSISTATGVAVLHDTSAAMTNGTLALRAHDGTRPLLTNGEYQLQITAIDDESGDSLTVSRRLGARASGNARAQAIPPFIPPASVREPPAGRAKLLLGGLAFAGATVALASGGRAEEPIRSGFAVDDRAVVVGGAMLAAAVAGWFIDRGKVRPPDQADIARARAAYDRRIAGIVTESKARADGYRVTVRLTPEERR